MEYKRQRGSFSARLRSEVHAPLTVEAVATANECSNEYPCPWEIRPLLYFYKYLQPLPDGRKLRLNLPATLVCEKRSGQENVLCLVTDSSGLVVKDDKGPYWRRRILSDFLGEDPQNAASLLNVGMDEVVAVRNVAHWKKAGGGGGVNTSASNNSKSIVLTRRAFDHVINAPTDLAFTVQHYVRCRGSHASIFRVTWGERENRRFAINIFNEAKIKDAPNGKLQSKPGGDEPEFHGTPLEAALSQMAQLSPFYCVSATSGRDLNKHQQHLKIPKVRGAPVAEGVEAVKRIVDHFTAQLPGIKVREMTADFIKDTRGVWWFIRVVCFNACYRVDIPQSVHEDPLHDSAVLIPESLRSKYFRQSLRTFTSHEPESSLLPHCTLCGSLCSLPKRSREDDVNRATAESRETMTEEAAIVNELSEYRMTVKMVVSTLFQLRQRGLTLPMWERTALTVAKSTTGPVSEFTVCFFCYRVYKAQVQLSRVAEDLHEVYGVSRPRDACDMEAESLIEGTSQGRLQKLSAISLVQARIQRFDEEQCLTFAVDDNENGQQPTTRYTSLHGMDIDPTCQQLRLVFFFHELQDGGPAISPTDFYLEYQLGQQFARLDFEGCKCHTPNRWQLCEARLHYLLATTDGFSDFCNDKRIRIKMKSVQGDEYHGHTSMSLRPLLSASKWYANSVQRETRVDFLLELKTDAFGLLTLKLTLGLLVDPVAFTQVRDLVKQDQYLREEPFDVFWPPATFQQNSLVVPVDWVGALTPSEYVSVVPMRSRLDGRQRAGYLTPARRTASHGRGGQRQLDDKSPSQRFSASTDTTTVPRQSSPRRASVTPLSTPTTVLSSVVAVIKRVVNRVAGEVSAFPTAAVGHLLRSAAFLSRDCRQGIVAAWTEPSPYSLSESHTLDTLFRDMQGLSVGAVCVVGELLLVLLSCRLAPPMLDLATVGRLLEPYWVLGHDSSTFLSFEMAAPSTCTAPPPDRAAWNRAIRRCQMSRLCPEVQASERPVARHQDHEEDTNSSRPPVTTFGELMALRRKTSYRAKLQAYTMCYVFESMESGDSGYIEIAELRSLFKFGVAQSCADQEQPPEQAQALGESLRSKDEAAFAAFVRCLMGSEAMQHYMNQFDTLGRGGMSFEEFRELTETAMKDAMGRYGSQQEEPTCSAFCLRHGVTTVYAMDLCCVECATQYQDQQFIPRGRSSTDGGSSDGDCEGTVDGEGESSDKDERESKMQPAVGNRPPHSPAQNHVTTASGKDRFDEPDLVDKLEKLEAAEWHVRYRHGSLGQVNLDVALSERKASIVNGRRSSPASSVSDRTAQKSTNASTHWLTELVAEAEERKMEAMQGVSRPIGRLGHKPSTVKKTKRKKKIPRTLQTSSNIHTEERGRLGASHSLSTLLRKELEDATKRARVSQHDAERSSKLVDAIHRGESKRKQLDRLVLEELEDVKQRLARLLQSC